MIPVNSEDVISVCRVSARKQGKDYSFASASILGEVRHLIPDDEFKTIMRQDECEYEWDFMGFTEFYHALSLVIPKGCTVIDFGCYLAAQAYFFRDHRKYIGVDVETMQRFTPDNTAHYISSIQDFIENTLPTLNLDPKSHSVFAICNFVPDEEARDLVKTTFDNVFCYYP